ncbi:hypothetical protein [Leisingera caerulea]|uniref:hypothetical protein n=1 Tax=Leisingera caerulea TaxID=506591 RepID=UPI0021A394C7|nr:hypothetical protein [Leisingera caerulea]
MTKVFLQIAAVAGICLVSACGSTAIPSQAALDHCRAETGLKTKLIVDTSPSGERSLRTDPPGTQLSAQEAIALKSCTDKF